MTDLITSDFENSPVRRIWHNNEWWFSVVDVIAQLTESPDPGAYWRVLKGRLKKEGSEQTVTDCYALKLKAKDGRMRKTDCANVETLFRLIQSVPSPKAEPVKRLIARLATERAEELADPEKGIRNAREAWEAAGRSEEWIAARLAAIRAREELTDEWDKRGIKESREYAILTAIIHKGGFNLTPSQHKAVKGLKRQNLRDHMTPLELALTMLGEASTTEIARETDAQGFDENKDAARQGGQIAGNARKEIEARTGKPVVSDENFLPKKKDKKKLKD